MAMDEQTRMEEGPAERATDGRASAPPRRRRRRRVGIGGTSAAVLAAIGVVHFASPERPLLSAPVALAAATAEELPSTPFGRVATHAFSRSGGVQMRFTLPGRKVEVPLTLAGDSTALSYTWVPVADTMTTAGEARPLAGDERLVAPSTPGFYRLALLRGGQRHIVDSVTVTVLVPFSEKRGGLLRGFRLGTYVGERLGVVPKGAPAGFFPVEREALALPVSKHLRLRDVLTTPDTPRDGFPQYATLDARLVEKLELVVAEIVNSANKPVTPRIMVNSGFRPPSYNARVKGAAKNSRHQYGDAADVKIDVNRDGRFSLDEVRVVIRAVEAVERAHPDLAGGMGVYTGKNVRQPYVHIDARGTRARWNGPG